MNKKPFISYLKTKVSQYKEKLFSHATLFTFFGVILLFFFWQVASVLMHSLIIASPKDTLIALYRMFGTEFFHEHFSVSLKRIFIGVSIGAMAGFALGIIAGLYENVKNLLEPFRWVLMSIPAVVVVVMAMLWFGMGTSMVVFITSVLLSPIVYVNTIKGMEMTDDNILEMAEIYRFSLWMKLKNIYVPAIIAPLSAAMAIVMGNGVRVVILSEVLGTNEGIGYALSSARTNLQVPELFACVFLSLIIVGLFEYLMLRPVQNYLLKWKT